MTSLCWSGAAVFCMFSYATFVFVVTVVMGCQELTAVYMHLQINHRNGIVHIVLEIILIIRITSLSTIKSVYWNKL